MNVAMSEQMLPASPATTALSHRSPSPSSSSTSSTSLSSQRSIEHPAPCRKLRKSVRSVLMRAGTSRGLFFHLADLPPSRDEWGPVILAAMGSPDPSLRQLDGLGAGYSTASKVAVISKSECVDADVDYLFIQVPVDGDRLDFSGNCGNMASGVGPFAIEEGLVKDDPTQGEHEVTVRIRNVNTDRIIHSSFLVSHGLPVEDGSFRLDGISTASSPIRLDFLDPSGSMTGKLLPTGRAMERITLPAMSKTVQVVETQNQAEARPVEATVPLPISQPPITYTVSAIDAANPFVFVLASELGLSGEESVSDIETLCGPTLAAIRAEMAVRMGMAPSVDQAAMVLGTPKIAIVGAPCDYLTKDQRLVRAEDIDIWVRAFSMGRAHPAIQMTGAICLGAASAVEGSIVQQIVQATKSHGREQRDGVMIGHASGTMMVQGDSTIERGELQVKSGSVYRTARRLMQGEVYYLANVQ